MPLRNGEHGYGLVTKLLHWLTVGAVTAQFVVGYRMEPHEGIAAAADAREDACRAEGDSEAAEAEEERCEEAAERREDQADAAEDAYVEDAFDAVVSGDALSGGLSAAEWHVLLGLSIVALALVRFGWRATTPLPPWSPAYSTGERALQGTLEKLMLALLVVVPLSGFLLVRAGAGLGVHIAAHIAFFVVVGLHVALQLFHTLLRPDRHLSRML